MTTDPHSDQPEAELTLICPDCGIDHSESDSFHAGCHGDVHAWSDWAFNYHRTAEYRLCSRCGCMEQQWIAVPVTPEDTTDE